MLADLRAWTTRRWSIAAIATLVAFAIVVLVAGLVRTSSGITIASDWWAIPVAAVGSPLIGMILASYTRTPIGADATLCDTRWPTLGLVAIILATDTRTVAPLLTGASRPVAALAAIALLVWALRERLSSEHRAIARRDVQSDVGDGEVCVTCRPLFPRATVEAQSPRLPSSSFERPLTPRRPHEPGAF